MNFEFVLPRYSRDVGTQRQEMEIFIRIFYSYFLIFNAKMGSSKQDWGMTWRSTLEYMLYHFQCKNRDGVRVNKMSPQSLCLVQHHHYHCDLCLCFTSHTSRQRNHFVRNCLLFWRVAWLVLEDTDACNYFQVVVQGAGGALTHRWWWERGFESKNITKT